MRIVFTEPAKVDLSELVGYYTNKGYRKAGRKIRAKIITKAMQLRSFPNLGKQEDSYSEKYQ